MIILGLNAFHADSSAALVRDGVLIAAAEEERFQANQALGRLSFGSDCILPEAGRRGT